MFSSTILHVLNYAVKTQQFSNMSKSFIMNLRKANERQIQFHMKQDHNEQRTEKASHQSTGSNPPFQSPKLYTYTFKFTPNISTHTLTTQVV